MLMPIFKKISKGLKGMNTYRRPYLEKILRGRKE
jgi:hypothetical protein